MRTDQVRTAAVLALVVGAPCSASPNTFLFTVSNLISPEQPSATVTLWGGFDPQWYAFARTFGLQVAARPDPGWFSDPEVRLFQKAGSKPGKVTEDGDRVIDILLIQLQFLGGQFADTHNPLELWSATWSTDDFTPREVALWTESKEYCVYVNDAGKWEDFYGIDFSEGAGLIQIVPAPPGAALLAAAALWRRRPSRAP